MFKRLFNKIINKVKLFFEEVELLEESMEAFKAEIQPHYFG